MFFGKTVSVVLATYKERKTVKRVINDFFETGYVDEVVVVDNNAEKGTVDEVEKTKARLVYEPRQGYGWAFQTGIGQARGEYIILCEPDGTFRPRDIEKFLIYAKDFDIVLGSRTGQNTPLSGADMTVTRKFANVIEAKTIEVLFNTNALTDIGCTYKLFGRDAVRKLSHLWRTRNSLFATELVLLTVSENMHFIEIPITFKKRVGVSSFVKGFPNQAKWAIRIQLYILFFWFRWIFRKIFNV